MRTLLRGKVLGLVAFALIAALVIGGLGWVTRAAVLLSRLQEQQQEEGAFAARLRVALWRLDRIASVLAREDSRPFNHYSAIYVPPVAMDGRGAACLPGAVVEPSPLLSAELPEWMLLHFQADADFGWDSPQVLAPPLARRLNDKKLQLALGNVTDARRRLLTNLAEELPAPRLLEYARKHASEGATRDRTLLRAERELHLAEQNPSLQNLAQQAQVANSVDYVNRSLQEQRLVGRTNNPRQVYAKNIAMLNFKCNGAFWLDNNDGPILPGAEVEVQLGRLVGLWLPTQTGSDQLVLLRHVRIEEKGVCQGIVLDGERLKSLLLEEVRELFPEADLVPVPPGESAAPERAMTALPFELVPGPGPAGEGGDGWSPLGVGLTLAWTAAGVALAAVGLGGWSLLELSERRIRFVQAVTHELRTPLTTLRLYLDMLLGGLVRDPDRQVEYLRTLHAEADRLNRLVSNVLDFARLENNRPRSRVTRVSVAEVLRQVQSTWQIRCQDAGKELLVESTAPLETTLLTDPELLQQVLANLLDNACKYSREAADPRLWIRAACEGGRLILEVEDRGPGVPRSEQRSIFHPFCRGKGSDTAAGGVGLGLALARRWGQLMGAKLGLRTPAEGGVCFRLEFGADRVERAPASEDKVRVG